MITLPSKVVPYICHDVLLTLATALFIEVEDKRIISLIDPTTIANRVEIIRESSVFESLIEALDIFGEDDVITLLNPKIIIFTDELSLGRNFKESLEDNFKDLT